MRYMAIPLTILSLLVAGIVIFAVVEARDKLSGLGTFLIFAVGVAVLLLLTAGAVLVYALYKHFNKPQVIHVGPYGTHVIHGGRTIKLEPLGGPMPDQQVVNAITPPPQFSSEVYYDDEDTEEVVTIGKEPSSDEVTVPDHLAEAYAAYKQGATGRESLSKALTESGGKKVSTHRASILLNAMRERRLIK